MCLKGRRIDCLDQEKSNLSSITILGTQVKMGFQVQQLIIYVGKIKRKQPTQAKLIIGEIKDLLLPRAYKGDNVSFGDGCRLVNQ